MKLSDKLGKYASILFTNSIKDKSPEVKMNGKTLKSLKQIKLLGIILSIILSILTFYFIEKPFRNKNLIKRIQKISYFYSFQTTVQEGYDGPKTLT